VNRRKIIQLLGGATLAGYTRGLRAAAVDRVVIVGAGIMGASIGYHMAKRGAQVMILERDRPVAGASRNSFAWLNAGTKAPRTYYELNMLGMLGWRRLNLEIGSALPIQWGGGVQWTDRVESAEKYRRGIRDQQREGYSVRLIDGSEVEQLLPDADPGKIAVASFADQEGTLDPVGATEALLDKAKSFGATLHYPCEVTGLAITAGRVRGVNTTQGTIGADRVVFAAGNGIPPLARAAGLSVPLLESPGVLAHTVPLPRLLSRVAISNRATLKQNPDGRIVTGTDFGGTPGVQATQEEGEKLILAAAKYLPALRPSQLDFVTLGHRVLPKDGHPIIGASKTYSNVYVVATHSGMTLAPIFGQLAAIEMLDQERIDLLESFRPERFD
jgi:glycine/D-amino acid oxidase-like deaminating enzyme